MFILVSLHSFLFSSNGSVLKEVQWDIGIDTFVNVIYDCVWISVCVGVCIVWVCLYRVPQKKLPLVKVSRGKYYCWQWEIHIELLQIQVKLQALLWRQVNVWVHVMNLSHIVLLFFKLDVVLLSLCHCLICNPTRW